MTMTKGTLVLVNRPNLPARIGRVVRIGSRGHIYVRVGKVGKLKRYSQNSVETLLRRVFLPSQ